MAAVTVVQATPTQDINHYQQLIVMLKAVSVHSLGVYRVDDAGKPTLSSCRLCGRWEGHDGICPVPSIESYLKQEGYLDS